MTIATTAILDGTTTTGSSPREGQIRCDFAPPRLTEDAKPDDRT